MFSGERVTFVWRCPDCKSAYGGEGLSFLHTDQVHWYCPCGGRVVEGVEPSTERHYMLVIPERLRGTSLHRQLLWRDAVEVTVGCERDRHIAFSSTN